MSLHWFPSSRCVVHKLCVILLSIYTRLPCPLDLLWHSCSTLFSVEQREEPCICSGQRAASQVFQDTDSTGHPLVTAMYMCPMHVYVSHDQLTVSWASVSRRPGNMTVYYHLCRSALSSCLVCYVFLIRPTVWADLALHCISALAMRITRRSSFCFVFTAEV